MIVMRIGKNIINKNCGRRITNVGLLPQKPDLNMDRRVT
jgi:hypothetical protein